MKILFFRKILLALERSIAVQKRSYSQNKKIFWLPLLLFFCIESPLFSQERNTDNEQETAGDTTKVRQQADRISVFLDCDACDNTFIRQEINFINYVRDPEQGQLHIFITTQGTASGGRIFTLSFIGKKNFEGTEHTLSYTSDQTNTQDEEREGLNAILQLGLVPYLLETSFVDNIAVDISAEPGERNSEEDPWNSWMFEVYGGLNFAEQSRTSSLDIRYGLYADYVTESWRIRLRPYFNYNQKDFIQDEENILRVMHRDGFEGKIVRSISQHWSIGGFADAISNTFENIQFGYRIAPAIEYSLLPYELALRKEYTVAYNVGYVYRNYFEETIYNQNKESLYDHSLKFNVRLLQPWGSVRAGLEGSQYLHDLSKNRISLDARLSLRVFQGLSVNFSSNYDYVQDQLSLPRGETSLEDLLLEQRQLATTYGISLSIGVSYNFGSIYNSVVNTRL